MQDAGCGVRGAGARGVGCGRGVRWSKTFASFRIPHPASRIPHPDLDELRRQPRGGLLGTPRP
jgi:hypothetical protein